jgi:hypothetical protein
MYLVCVLSAPLELHILHQRKILLVAQRKILLVALCNAPERGLGRVKDLSEPLHSVYGLSINYTHYLSYSHYRSTLPVHL